MSEENCFFVETVPPLQKDVPEICGKFPAAARPQAAQPGFPTATAELSGAEPSSGSGAVASPWPQGHVGTTPAQAVAEAPSPFLQNGFDVGLPAAVAQPRAGTSTAEQAASVVMTTKQRALVVALVSEYLRDTEDWLSVREKNSMEALLDTLQGAAS